MNDLQRGVLFTDQYQLTMAQLYFEQDLHERTAVFDHFYRSNPDYGSHQAGYCVTAGLGPLLDWMHTARFGDEEIAALRSQRRPDGAQRFGEEFLEWLREDAGFERLHLKSIPEGRVVHPHEPIITVEGPLAVAQILETSLLNHLNHPTLVATKAARVVEVARGGTVLEFGMRRGATWGVNPAARAAFVGGVDGTSNVGASHALGRDPMGTHAHSMVQAFLALGLGERAAFQAYADVYPDECILLVDTVDTLGSGIPNAIRVFEELRRRGHRPVGVRIDSGDLAHLAVESARMLDAAGFEDATIVLSSDLDELAIWQIVTQVRDEAPLLGLDPAAVIGRLSYGVGTRLVTSHGAPALGGVYKLVAIDDSEGVSRPAIKISQNPIKVPVPGRKRLWRVTDQRGKAVVDVIAHADEPEPGGSDLVLHHPAEPAVSRTLPKSAVGTFSELLVDVWNEGRDLTGPPSLEELSARCHSDIGQLDQGVRRLVNPHVYHVSMTATLADMRQRCIEDASRPVDD